MLVEPAARDVGLPFGASIDSVFDATFERYRLAVRKCVFVYQTCFCRSALFVVLPHSRSIVPLAKSGMRVDAVTGVYVTSSVSSFNSCFTASTIFAQISIENPIGCCLSSM